MKKTRKPARKPLRAMKTAELAEATAAYGEEMAIDAFKPLSRAARSRWDRAKRKPGRPRRGEGVKVISLSVEQDLLQRSDELARSLGVSRARLIERGLETVLAKNAKETRNDKPGGTMRRKAGSKSFDSWLANSLAKDAALAERVEKRLAELRVEQDFIARLADRLVHSSDASEQARLKKELARRTFGE